MAGNLKIFQAHLSGFGLFDLNNEYHISLAGGVFWKYSNSEIKSECFTLWVGMV